MVVGGSNSGNNGNYDDVRGLGENCWGKGGRVRTVKDANVQGVDVKADGEGLTLPSSSPIDGDRYGDRDGFGDKNYGWGSRDRPCASA